jgi:hypothetical protein
MRRAFVAESRLIAAGLALGVNFLLVTALATSGRWSGGPLVETRERVMVILLGATTAVRPSPAFRKPHVNRVRVSVPMPHAILELTTPSGPPTEVPASLLPGSEVDLEAGVRNAPALRELCGRAYPDELTSDEAKHVRIVLRIYVMPDGRIGQGTVTDSSGSEHLDWLTLQCLQARADLQPALDGGFPVGSWQRLVWHWSVP